MSLKTKAGQGGGRETSRLLLSPATLEPPRSAARLLLSDTSVSGLPRCRRDRQSPAPATSLSSGPPLLADCCCPHFHSGGEALFSRGLWLRPRTPEAATAHEPVSRASSWPHVRGNRRPRQGVPLRRSISSCPDYLLVKHVPYTSAWCGSGSPCRRGAQGKAWAWGQL